MSLEKATLGLYDFLGYLLPGIIVLVTLAIIEATLLSGSFLSLEIIQKNWLFSTILAYFIGHILQAAGSLLQNSFYDTLTTKKNKLSRPLYNKVKSLVQKRFQFSDEDMKELKTLDIFLLCDTYTIGSNGANEREMILSKEGFYRGTYLAFFILSLVLFVSSLMGGMRFYLSKSDLWGADCVMTFLFAILSGGIGWLMLTRFKFFHRVKNNFSKLIFLSSGFEE